MISSTKNAKIRELVRLKKNAKERSRSGVFLVEGAKMVREIPRGLCLGVYVSESFLLTQEGAMLTAGGPDGSGTLPEAEAVSDEVFRYLSDTKSPQGILAVVRQLRYELKDLVQRPSLDGSERREDGDRKAEDDPETADDRKAAPLIIVLENLQDPGNLGTILRTAEAAGASGILLGRGCADLYNPKVTRSTMGSIFRVPFVYSDHLKEAILELKAQGVRIFAAHLRGSVNLYEASFKEAAAFLIGNESRGLTEETAALADQAVRIPMSGSVESLNAAVAASVLMFEAKRQRTV